MPRTQRPGLPSWLLGTLRGSVVMAVMAVMPVMPVMACGGGHAAGPAWPKGHAPETDGGESLEPRQASVVAAIEGSEDDTPSTSTSSAEEDPDAAASTSHSERSTSSEPASTRDDVLTIEEIIIEIDD